MKTMVKKMNVTSRTMSVKSVQRSIAQSSDIGGYSIFYTTPYKTSQNYAQFLVYPNYCGYFYADQLIVGLNFLKNILSPKSKNWGDFLPFFI